jgi:hypothetical protein
MNKKGLLILAIITFTLLIIFVVVFYKHDRNKYEPRLWIGFFDYRLNFRDVGESLNKCLNQNIFQSKKIYRSNRYFSGWSCNKIGNPDKIYSLNYSPWNPHSYYCKKPDNKNLFGFHPNTSFEISDIEILENWNKPEFKNTMCIFFKETFNDLINHNSFLYHCDMGRDRTGAFTAMLTMSLAEANNYPVSPMQDAIECDYQKTHSLEKNKIGKMKHFLIQMENQGGVSRFLEQTCGIDKMQIKNAARNFFK